MQTNASELRKDYDVVIVGAGLAGLSAAYYMKKQCKELSILIIEGILMLL